MFFTSSLVSQKNILRITLACFVNQKELLFLVQSKDVYLKLLIFVQVLASEKLVIKIDQNQLNKCSWLAPLNIERGGWGSRKCRAETNLVRKFFDICQQINVSLVSSTLQSGQIYTFLPCQYRTQAPVLFTGRLPAMLTHAEKKQNSF